MPRVSAANATRTLVLAWLGEHHDGVPFNASLVAKTIGRHGSTTAGVFKDLLAEGYPGLERVNRTTLTYQPGGGEAKLRIIAEPPVLLRPGAKLEVVGATPAGVIVARDAAMRLWTLHILEAATP